MTGVSGTLLDHHARALIAGITTLGSVLDIGPGQGKYGRMARALRPEARLVGLEIEADYAARFGLAALYDEVRIGPALSLLDAPEQTWDLVILGDVLEHMRRSEGLDVLHFLVYRARYLWVQWPLRYIQGALDGYRHEAHISVWTERDIQALNTDYVKVEAAPLEGYAIDGYPNAGRRVAEILELFPTENRP